MKCPYCNGECSRSTEKAMAAAGGMAVRSDGHYQFVYRCSVHGIMRIANLYSDAYMAKAFPDLHLVKGAWIPRNWEPPKTMSTTKKLYRTEATCGAHTSPCESEDCRVCWTETCPW